MNQIPFDATKHAKCKLNIWMTDAPWFRPTGHYQADIRGKCFAPFYDTSRFQKMKLKCMNWIMIEPQLTRFGLLFKTWFPNRSRSRFSHVFEFSEPKQVWFYLTKTYDFEKDTLSPPETCSDQFGSQMQPKIYEQLSRKLTTIWDGFWSSPKCIFQ